MGKEHFLLREKLIKLQIKFFILINLSKLRRKLKNGPKIQLSGLSEGS
jgi:hypothetical protein